MRDGKVFFFFYATLIHAFSLNLFDGMLIFNCVEKKTPIESITHISVSLIRDFASVDFTYRTKRFFFPL